MDPKSFAAKVNYLAATSKRRAPDAFTFADRKILFVGYAPFHIEELGSLLPEEVEWHEHGDTPEEFVLDILVLGREGLKKGVSNP